MQWQAVARPSVLVNGRSGGSTFKEGVQCLWLMDTVVADVNLKLERARALLGRARVNFLSEPFQPHSLFKGGHAQTLVAFAWPRRHRFRSVHDEERIFDVAEDVKVLGHCRWHEKRTEKPTLVMWHGIEGSSASTYMLSIAEKAFAAGFNVIRMNLRTCGGTEHLTSSIYHGGLTEDLREVVRQLIEVDQLSRLILVGFSLGGNMVLKLAGEYGPNPPKEILAIAALSPSIDLNASAELILKRSNWIYNRDFVDRMKKRIRLKHKLYPQRYDISGLRSVRTLREFDNRFTAKAHGFADAEDYYYKASSIRVIDRIEIPALIIHAQDDPFIPFSPMRDAVITNNPYILLVEPEQGGHVAFVSSKSRRARLREARKRANHHSTGRAVTGLAKGISQKAVPAGFDSSNHSENDSRFTNHDSRDEDRFWAENRIVDFCKLAVENY